MALQPIEQQQQLSSDTQPTSKTRTIAFQGERGAFGDEAVQRYFGKNEGEQAEPVPCRTFADVFRAVAIGEVDNGLVPVENFTGRQY